MRNVTPSAAGASTFSPEGGHFSTLILAALKAWRDPKSRTKQAIAMALIARTRADGVARIAYGAIAEAVQVDERTVATHVPEMLGELLARPDQLCPNEYVWNLERAAELACQSADALTRSRISDGSAAEDRELFAVAFDGYQRAFRRVYNVAVSLLPGELDPVRGYVLELVRRWSRDLKENPFQVARLVLELYVDAGTIRPRPGTRTPCHPLAPLAFLRNCESEIAAALPGALKAEHARAITAAEKRQRRRETAPPPATYASAIGAADVSAAARAAGGAW